MIFKVISASHKIWVSGIRGFSSIFVVFRKSWIAWKYSWKMGKMRKNRIRYRNIVTIFNQLIFMHLELMIDGELRLEKEKRKGYALRTVLTTASSASSCRRTGRQAGVPPSPPTDLYTAAFMTRTRIVYALQKSQTKIADFEWVFVYVCELICKSNTIFRTRITYFITYPEHGRIEKLRAPYPTLLHFSYYSARIFPIGYFA